MTPRQIQRAIDAEEAAIQADRVDILRREARLVVLRELLRLHSSTVNSTVDGTMETEHRLAISRGRTSGRDKKFDAALQAKGFSRTTFAAALGIHKSALSHYRAGARETPLAVREHAHTLIGWPASSWPKLGS